MKLNLIRFNASKLLFENKLDKSNGTVKFKQKFNTKVHFYEDNKCSCMYEVIVTDVDDVLPFKIIVEVVGLFTYDTNLSKPEIHVETTKQLFPYLKATVTQLSTLSGFPPFYLQPHEIRLEDVKSGKNPDIIMN